MTIKLIVACDYENGIGRDGEIPWKLPGDLRRFKRLTKGSCVIMGRKTFESIGKPLPGRLNIIVSNSQTGNNGGGVIWVKSIEAALNFAGNDCWIIGGERLYAATLPIADMVFMTDVYGEFGCDRFFPKLNNKEFYCYADTDGESLVDKASGVEFRHMIYVRKK